MKMKVILLLGLLLFVQSVFASPTSPQVKHGEVTVTTSGNKTTVNQSTSKGIINWESFNIGENESIRFNQPNEKSITLNRVTGSGVSTINGELTANGQIFLINRAGIIFGATANVDVAGLIVSASDIENNDFINGDYYFGGNPNPNAKIVNAGTITASEGGYVGLVAPVVENSGVITANLGDVVLASGREFTLDFYGDNLINFTINKGTNGLTEGHEALVKNSGKIVANGGKILLTAKTIGTVLDNIINTTGTIEANTIGINRGEIYLQGGDSVNVSASGNIYAQGKGSGESGGDIKLYGKNLELNNITIDASGKGKGGFIETSGNNVEFGNNLKIKASSEDGEAGLWLIDPTNIIIEDNDAAIYSTQLNGGINVTIQTDSIGGEAGNITFNNTTVPISWTTDNKLTVNAHNDILFSDNPGTKIIVGGTGSLVLRADYDADGVGTIHFANTTTAGVQNNSGGEVELFYNPTSYTSPNNYTFGANGGVSGSHTAYMLVNDLGPESPTGSDKGLQAMELNLGGNYALGKNIDASATSSWNGGLGFAPIGGYLKGNFNGNGHVISGLYIDRPSQYYVGLFGGIRPEYLGDILIKDLTLKDINIVGDEYVGGLVGWAVIYGHSSTYNGNLTIRNVKVTGASSVKGGTRYVGGLIGNYTAYEPQHRFLVESSSSSADVSIVPGVISSGHVGGLIGESGKRITLRNSYATGSVTGGALGTSIGGLIGSFDSDGNNEYSQIENSYATGDVSGKENVGGLIGELSSASIPYNTPYIKKSYATGNVSGEKNVGGLIGNLSSVSTLKFEISDVYSTGSVTGIGGASSEIGGLIGWISNSEIFINRAYSTGSVTGDSNVGGFIGKINDPYVVASISNSFWSSELSGQSVPIASGSTSGTSGVYDRTEAQLKQESTFTTGYGWDFTPGTGTWEITEGVSYPIFQYQDRIISGSVYSDQGVTLLNAGKIGLAINGDLYGVVDISESGGYEYTIKSLEYKINPGDKFLLYIMSAESGGYKGNTLYVSDGGSVYGLDIFGNTVSVSSGSGEVINNIALVGAKYSGATSDLLYQTSGNNVNLDQNVNFLAKSEYTLNGNMTTQGTGFQKYESGLVLTNDAILTSATGNITLSGDINGDYSITATTQGILKIEGGDAIIGNLIATSDAGIDLSSNITTSANQTYNNDVTLTGDVELTGANINLNGNLTGSYYWIATFHFPRVTSSC